MNNNSHLLLNTENPVFKFRFRSLSPQFIGVRTELQLTTDPTAWRLLSYELNEMSTATQSGIPVSISQIMTNIVVLGTRRLGRPSFFGSAGLDDS